MKTITQINARLQDFSDKYQNLPLDKRHEFNLLKSALLLIPLGPRFLKKELARIEFFLAQREKAAAQIRSQNIGKKRANELIHEIDEQLQFRLRQKQRVAILFCLMD